jgi:hypothetical protein
MGPMILLSSVLATLLMIGGGELNPGPVDIIVQVLCSGYDRNSSLELSVNRVALEMISFNLRAVENGTATYVDL